MSIIVHGKYGVVFLLGMLTLACQLALGVFGGLFGGFFSVVCVLGTVLFGIQTILLFFYSVLNELDRIAGLLDQQNQLLAEEVRARGMR